MEKHIAELIKNNVRVVLPDLGAFIVKQRKPLKIIFNEFLKYNDGLLIEYVTKTEGKDKEQVSKDVNAFVASLKEKLNKDEKIKFAGFGILSKDASGNIAFDLEGDEGAPSSSEQQAPTSSPPPPVKKETPKKEEKAKEPEKPISKPNATSTVFNQPKKEEKPIETKKPPTTYTSNKYVQQPNEKNEKKKVYLWVAAAILAVIIVLLTMFINNSSKEESETIYQNDNETLQPTEEIISPEPEISEEPEKKEPVKAKVAPSTSNKTANRTGQYHIIAGSFKVPSNAVNYEKVLIDQGYKAKNIGSINGFHMVAIQSFPTLREATTAIDEVRSNVAEGAWIIKF